MLMSVDAPQRRREASLQLGRSFKPAHGEKPSVQVGPSPGAFLVSGRCVLSFARDVSRPRLKGIRGQLLITGLLVDDLTPEIELGRLDRRGLDGVGLFGKAG